MERKIDKISLLIKFIYMNMFIVSFAFYEKMHLFYKMFTILVVIDLVYLFIKNYRKKEYDFKLIMLISLFMFTHFITALANYNENFFGNIIEIIFMFSYCLLTIIYDKNNIEKLFKMNVYFINVFTFIIPISTLFVLINKYNFILEVTEEKRYMFGIFRGRVWPLINPNTMAALSYISIILSIILILRQNKKNIFLKINVLTQFIFFSLQQSRGAMLSCSVMIVLYLLFIKKENLIYKKIIKAPIFILIFLFLVFSINMLFNIILNSYEAEKGFVIYKDNYSNSYVMKELEENNREENKMKIRFNDSTTNGRYEIWQGALKMISNKTIFGYGVRNIEKNYIGGLNKQIVHNANFHNIYLNVLVSGGILNLIVFLVIVSYFIYKFLYYLIFGKSNDIKIVLLLFFGILTSEFFESTILYVTSYLNIFFWFITGYGLYLCNKDKEVDFKLKSIMN